MRLVRSRKLGGNLKPRIPTADDQDAPAPDLLRTAIRNAVKLVTSGSSALAIGGTKGT